MTPDHSSAQPQQGTRISNFFRRPRMAEGERGAPIRHGLSTGAATALNGLVRFATNNAVGRLAGPDVLGTFTTLLAFGQLLSLLSPSSAGRAATKFVAAARGRGDRNEAEAAATHLASRALQSIALLTVIAAPLWIWVTEPDLVSALSAVMLTCGYSAMAYARGLQFGSGLIRRVATWDILAAIASFVGVAALLLLGATSIGLTFPLSLTYLIYGYCNWPRRTVSERPARGARKQMDRFILWGVIGTVASSGFVHLATIYVRAVEGERSAGLFAAAMTLATPVALVAAVLSLVLFPSLSSAWGRGDVASAIRQSDIATRALSLVMVPMVGSLMLFSEPLVATIWGSAFGDATTTLPILLLAVLLNSLSVGAVNSLTSRDPAGVRTSALASFAGLVIGVACWIVLVPRFGFEGVAVGYAFGVFAISSVPYLLVWRRDGHNWALLTVRNAVFTSAYFLLAICFDSNGAHLWTRMAGALVLLTACLITSWTDTYTVRRALFSAR